MRGLADQVGVDRGLTSRQSVSRDRPAPTFGRSATLRQKLLVQFLIQSHHTDTGPTSPSSHPITPDARQGGHESTNLQVTSLSRLGQTGVGPLTPDLKTDV